VGSAAQDIVEILDDDGIGDIGVNLFANREPVKPNTCITVYNTDGANPVLIRDELRNPGIMIKVRSVDYEAAHAIQEQIINALCVARASFIQGDHRYVGVWQQGDIIMAGRDDNDRYMLTTNYLIQRHPVEGS